LYRMRCDNAAGTAEATTNLSFGVAISKVMPHGLA
jgi:hypothetical protein